MSAQGSNMKNSECENFKRYLSEHGVTESLTNVLANLYELEIRPTDPLDFIRTHMTEIVNEREELKNLKAKYDHMIIEIKELEEENMTLAQTLKHLENYENLNTSKFTKDVKGREPV